MSAFAPAFLGRDPRAVAFLPDEFRDASRRADSVRRALSVPRGSSLVPRGSVAVVTGQQVGLFLGPLYSLYKAASTIAVARALAAETGVPCVPVFWLQSEDHDFAEINHVTVHGRDGELTRLQLDSPHVARASVSSISLGAGVAQTLAGLATALDSLPHADEVLALFSRHYRPDATWVSAFAGVLRELLPELLVVDPRDEANARAVRPVHERAFVESDALTRVLHERERALEAAGFDVQVKVRDVPLSFVHPEGRDGPRHRGEKILSDDPLCLSSSALLRPIVQDTLLPTAAIIGGPGELNYFAQLAPLYAHFGLPMPMVMPRARFRVVEPRVRAVLTELGLGAADVEVPREALLARVVTPRPGEVPAVELERRLVAATESVLGEATGAPPRALARARRTFAKTAQRFALRYGRAQLERDGITAARVDRVQRALFPHGEPQERVLGLAGFAARLGVKRFVELVREGITPFGVEVKDLHA